MAPFFEIAIHKDSQALRDGALQTQGSAYGPRAASAHRSDLQESTENLPRKKMNRLGVEL
jgi:hypothetical protein